MVVMFLPSAATMMRKNLPKAFAGVLRGGAAGGAAAVTSSSQWLFELVLDDASLGPPILLPAA